jgi:hypothetical protein
MDSPAASSMGLSGNKGYYTDTDTIRNRKEKPAGKNVLVENDSGKKE